MRRFAKVSDFLNDESGATAIEYALIAGGIASAVAAGVTALSGTVTALWTKVSTAMP